MERLDRAVDHIGKTFHDAGDTLHLQGVERRGMDQLKSLADETAGRVRGQVAMAPLDDSRLFLLGELDAFHETVAGFTGAFRQDQERDLLAAGRVQIIEATLIGLAELGRGKEARALLQNEEIASHLDAVTRARLRKNTKALTRAHDRDRVERGKREIAEQANKREAAALAFTTGFRRRLTTGETTLAEITGAETEGILTPARADRLRTELTDEQIRRDKVSAGAERITLALQAGDRLNPADFGDQDDVAHHYAATLKPSLTDLEPAQKAAAISSYVADTGIVPDAALKTLLGLAVTGEPTGRIAAAQALKTVFIFDPTAPDQVPRTLLAHAHIMAQLAETGSIAPEEIIKVADALIGMGAPGAGADQPSPALIQLAKAENNAGAQPSTPPGAAGANNTALTEIIEDTEVDDDISFDEDGLLSGEGNDASIESFIEQFGILRDTLADEGNAESNALVGSIDALVGAIDRHDPEEIETQIAQLEKQVADARARQPHDATPDQLASLDGIGTQVSPSAADDEGFLGKFGKALGQALILLELARRIFGRQGDRDNPPDFPPTTEQEQNDDQPRLGTGSDTESKGGSLEESERDARMEGQSIQKLLGLSPKGDVEKIADKIADMASDQFQKTKNFKVVLNLSEISPDANEQSAIQGLINVHRKQRLTPNDDSVVSLNLGPVDPELAKRVKVETGIDISGLHDTIDTKQINHVFRRHGPGKEKDPGQLPVSPEAIATYRHVVRNFDRLTAVRKRKGSGATLQFEKDINGVAVVVQQVRKGKKEFALFTMWIKRRNN